MQEEIEADLLEQDKIEGSESFLFCLLIKSVLSYMILFSIFLLLLCIGCNSDKSSNQREEYYIHVDGRDTSRLRLVRYENRFFGKYTHTKGGVAPVVGEINGDIKGDTLIGDNHYTPYRWKEKKRAPIVLLKKGNTYIEGDGQKIEFMGVISFIEWTLKFDPPKRIYKPEKKFEELIVYYTNY